MEPNQHQNQPQYKAPTAPANAGEQELYHSADELVVILTTDRDDRYPRHSYRTTVVRLRPRWHSRCRQFYGYVEWMPTASEIRALLEGLAAAGKKLDIGLHPSEQDKPQWRKEGMHDWNLARIAKEKGRKS